MQVVHLNVHLPNGQRVCFNENNVLERLENPKNTTLLAFFQLCCKDDFPRTPLYSEVPSYYIWTNNMFQKRKKGVPLQGLRL